MKSFCPGLVADPELRLVGREPGAVGPMLDRRLPGEHAMDRLPRHEIDDIESDVLPEADIRMVQPAVDGERKDADSPTCGIVLITALVIRIEDGERRVGPEEEPRTIEAHDAVVRIFAHFDAAAFLARFAVDDDEAASSSSCCHQPVGAKTVVPSSVTDERSHPAERCLSQTTRSVSRSNRPIRRRSSSSRGRASRHSR